jgi:hypothetical protein
MIKQIIIGSSGFTRDASFAMNQQLGIFQIPHLWSNLLDTTQFNLGGLLGNIIYYILIFYWIYKSNFRRPTDLLLLIFLSVMIVPYIIGDVETQSRVLYEIPVQIPMGIALSWLYTSGNRFFTISLCVLLISISLRAISNFYFATLE